MIPPEFYDVNLSLLSVHKELQEEILRDIVRRLQKTDFSLTLTAEWQTEKLLQTGKLYEEILSEIAKRTGKQKAEIARVFENAEIEMTERAEALCTATGEKIENLSPALHKTIRAALSKTVTEAANLTKTTAVTAQTAYIFAADIAHQKVVSGAFSYDEAIRSAVLSAAGKDLTVVYPSGHVDSLDVAVRRAVLTGTNQTAGKIADTVGEELELDLREITAHAGARPEHAVWQGKIVSMSGRKGYLSPADIGYGDVRGFMGANCRHNWYPYIEGTPRSYTDAELAEMARETVTVDGEELPLYEAIQKQRGYERAVRKTKRELVALDELSKNEKDPIKLSADKAEFSARSVKLKTQEARLSDFCKKAGLDRDRTREQVFSTKTENGIKNFGKSVSGKAVWANRKATSISESGISGKKHLSTEENRVNFEYINSKEYKAKFDRISDNKAVNDAIYAQAKAILTHRSGTYFEDLSLIDGDNGKVMAGTSNSKTENVVMYSKLVESAISENPYKLIAIHNHGTNNPPTGSDFVSAGYHKYRLGIVACHNGDVYTYEPGKSVFYTENFDKSVDIYKKSGYTEHKAIVRTLNLFAKMHGIRWKKL